MNASGVDVNDESGDLHLGDGVGKVGMFFPGVKGTEVDAGDVLILDCRISDEQLGILWSKVVITAN